MFETHTEVNGPGVAMRNKECGEVGRWELFMMAGREKEFCSKL